MIDDIKLNSLNAFDPSQNREKGLLEKGLSTLFGSVLSGGEALAGIGGGGLGGGLDGLFDDQQRFFLLQLQVQQQQQIFTTQTNLAKADHEARMSAVRNMKP